VVPATYVAGLRWTPSVERWKIALDASIAVEQRDDLQLRVRLQAGEQVVTDDTYAVSSSEIGRTIALSDPGIDDYRNELLWSPDSPKLIDAEIHLLDGKGRAI